MNFAAWILNLLWACQARDPGPIPLAVATAPVRMVAIPKSSDNVSFALSLRAGSVHEMPGRHGVAAMTALYAAEGSDLQVDIDDEMIRFSFQGPVNKVCENVERFRALLPLGQIQDDRLKTIKSNMVAQLKRAPSKDVFRAWLFDGRPYGTYAYGRLGSLSSVSAIEMNHYAENRFVRGAAVLGVSGPLVTEKGVLDRSVEADCIRSIQSSLSDALPPLLHKNATPRRIEFPSLRDVLLLTTTQEKPVVLFGKAVDQAMGDPNWASSLIGLTIAMHRLQSDSNWRRAPQPEKGKEDLVLESNSKDLSAPGEHQEIPFVISSPTLEHFGTTRVQSDLSIELIGLKEKELPYALQGLLKQLSTWSAPDELELKRAKESLSQTYSRAASKQSLKWAEFGALLDFSLPQFSDQIASVTSDQAASAFEMWSSSGLKILIGSSNPDQALSRLNNAEKSMIGGVFSQSFEEALR